MKHLLETCQRHAEKYEGYCHSAQYLSAKKKLKWECKRGHKWEACFKDIQRGHWCKKCSDNSFRFTIEHCQKLAQRNNGECLSTTYKTAHGKYRWRCDKGHIWTARYSDIQKGHWCFKCRRGFGLAEENVLTIIERLTGWKFAKVRPAFLKGYSSHPMELDGYNEEHRIAFEYQGEYHYKPIHGEAKLRGTKRNDDRKRKLCQRHGVTLIRVPYFKRNIEAFLKRRLAQHHHGEMHRAAWKADMLVHGEPCGGSGSARGSTGPRNGPQPEVAPGHDAITLMEKTL